ncbi:hypothetical protein VTN00DRAFT_2256 [Thermoascus crustaceus]|uniref:uncharacterized protein n=1 Tax=Thermoascus crustaceus TaxID=5088 RepID=UPI0037444ED4
MDPQTELHPSSTTYPNASERSNSSELTPLAAPPSDPDSSNTTTPSNSTPMLELPNLRSPDSETAVPPANTNITPNTRSKWHWTTRDQRRDILLMRRLGYSYEQISQHLGVTIRKVQYTCQSQSDTPKKPSGRRSKLGEAQLDKVEAFITACPENRRMSYRKVIEALELGVSEECLSRALARRGYHRREASSVRRKQRPTAAVIAATAAETVSDINRRDNPEVWGKQMSR